MNDYKVKINEAAIIDIKKAVKYYETKSIKVSKFFANQVRKSIYIITKNPFFEIRYDNIRCLPLKRFPYMIHFSINEKIKLVEIFGVIHTSLNPDNHWINS